MASCLLLGTSRKRSAEFIQDAIEAGFRSIDTASAPFNYDEAALGQALRRFRNTSANPFIREQFFIQTRFAVSIRESTQTLEAFIQQKVKSSLDATGLDYLDCVLLNAAHTEPEVLLASWKVLETYIPATIRSLGLSNVDAKSLEWLLSNPLTTSPRIVQNRFHWLNKFDQDVRLHCARNSIDYQAFGVVGGNKTLLSQAIVGWFAEQHSIYREISLYILLASLGSRDEVGSSLVQVASGSGNLEHLEQIIHAFEQISVGEGVREGFLECLDQVYQRFLCRYTIISGQNAVMLQ